MNGLTKLNKISWLICGGTVFTAKFAEQKNLQVTLRIQYKVVFVQISLEIVFGKVLYSNLEIDNLEFRNHYCN